MNIHLILKKNPMFRAKSESDIEEILKHLPCKLQSYVKNGVIVLEGDPALRMGFVISGKVEVQKTYPTGRSVTITRLGEGQTFGEAVLFSRANRYPATIVASEPAEILFIAKTEIIKLFSMDAEIMGSFLEIMSERLVMLNQKIEILSLGTLRQRIAYSLLKEMQKSKSSLVTLPYSKRVWAEHLNTARPSLSRELGHMRDLGWIEFDGSTFRLLNVEALEGLLG